MNPLVLGIVVGIILTLFCMFCIDAWALDNRISDSELEAWEERQEEQEIDKQIDKQEHYIKKLWEGIARLEERERRERKGGNK